MRRCLSDRGHVLSVGICIAALDCWLVGMSKWRLNISIRRRWAWASFFNCSGDTEKDPATGLEVKKASSGVQSGLPLGDPGDLNNCQGPNQKMTVLRSDLYHSSLLDFSNIALDFANYNKEHPSTAVNWPPAPREPGAKKLPPAPKLNVSHLFLRWNERLFFWDKKLQRSRPRNPARKAVEASNLEEFVSDLLVTDPRYTPECPPLLRGFDCSHLAESYHNPVDWFKAPQIHLCPIMDAGSSAPKSKTEALRERFSKWLPGYRVEHSESATDDHNRSRQTCTYYQLMWREVDGTEINPSEGTRRWLCFKTPDTTPAPPSQDEGATAIPSMRDIEVFLGGDDTAPWPHVEIPDEFPTGCIHSRYGNPCFGPPGVPARVATGATPVKRRKVKVSGCSQKPRVVTPEPHKGPSDAGPSGVGQTGE